MKKLFFIHLLMISFSTFSGINSDALNKNLEKIVLYCKRCDENKKNNKNIVIQPIISMIINKQNKQFNSLLNDENKKNRTKYIKNYDKYNDILDNINTILLFKHIAKLHNTSVLEIIKERYQKCYKSENECFNILSKIKYSNFDTEYVLSKHDIDKKFETYVEKLVRDISE